MKNRLLHLILSNFYVTVAVPIRIEGESRKKPSASKNGAKKRDLCQTGVSGDGDDRLSKRLKAICDDKPISPLQGPKLSKPFVFAGEYVNSRIILMFDLRYLVLIKLHLY